MDIAILFLSKGWLQNIYAKYHYYHDKSMFYISRCVLLSSGIFRYTEVLINFKPDIICQLLTLYAVVFYQYFLFQLDDCRPI